MTDERHASEPPEELQALIASVEELRALLAPLSEEDRARVLDLARRLRRGEGEQAE
jgi:hypothetical protein